MLKVQAFTSGNSLRPILAFLQIILDQHLALSFSRGQVSALANFFPKTIGFPFFVQYLCLPYGSPCSPPYVFIGSKFESLRQCLKKTPFEPIRNIPLFTLTYKSCQPYPIKKYFWYFKEVLRPTTSFLPKVVFMLTPQPGQQSSISMSSSIRRRYTACVQFGL